MVIKTIGYPKTVVDPVLSEVRRHQQETAAAFGFDVMALGRSLQQRESGAPRFKTPGGGQDAVAQPTTYPESS
jgi:hypothetical protein